MVSGKSPAPIPIRANASGLAKEPDICSGWGTTAMSFFPSLLIQIGLLFAPFLFMLVVNARVRHRGVRFCFAIILALAAGWAAYEASTRLGWKPRLKGGHIAGLSPLFLFGAFGAGHFIALLFFVFAKDRSGRGGMPPREFEAGAPARENAWRVGHIGRDQMYYEEANGSAWRRIEIPGEMLMGRAHHVIYFPSSREWRERYPDWAWDRRDEIITRICSAFRSPDYEYHGL